MRMNTKFKLPFTADTGEQVKRWSNLIRMRVGSSDLLYQQVQGDVGSMVSFSGLDELKKRTEIILVRSGGLYIEDLDKSGAESPSQVDNISEVQERMKTWPSSTRPPRRP